MEINTVLRNHNNVFILELMQESNFKFIKCKLKFLFKPTIHQTNQPTDRPTNQATDQPTDKPTNQPTDQPTNQPTNQPQGDNRDLDST